MTALPRVAWTRLLVMDAPGAGLVPLPTEFVTTREALWALACYVMGPASKVRTERIGLRPFGAGLATRVFADGTRLAVEGGVLRWVPGDSLALTTIRDAAAWVGVELSADPGVGEDLPPFAPDAPLAVDAVASRALGGWYAYAAQVLTRIAPSDAAVSEAQLWPEHFDLAIVVDSPAGGLNVGGSPGDADHAEPYVYVGPHDRTGLDGDYWNAPFGALLPYGALLDSADAVTTAVAFVETGLALVRERSLDN